MQYYWATKSSQVLAYAIIWMNLKNTALNEKKQLQNATSCVIPLIWSIQNRQLLVSENNWCFPLWGFGEGEWRLTAMGIGDSFGGNKNGLKLIWWWLYNSMNIWKTTEFYGMWIISIFKGGDEGGESAEYEVRSEDPSWGVSTPLATRDIMLVYLSK